MDGHSRGVPLERVVDRRPLDDFPSGRIDPQVDVLPGVLAQLGNEVLRADAPITDFVIEEDFNFFFCGIAKSIPSLHCALGTMSIPPPCGRAARCHVSFSAWMAGDSSSNSIENPLAM